MKRNMKMMKRLLVVLVCLLLLGIIAFVVCRGRKPFRDLDASQIVFATVRLTPPDKTIQITEIEEFAEYLKDVVVYQKDQSYTEYSGQGVLFTLTMSDGTQTEILAYNPFLVIDWVGYKTEYAPCEALSQYANQLLADEHDNRKE